MEELLDLNGVNENMFGYYIVSKIYDIRDILYFSKDRIECDKLLINNKILNYIDEINFIYVKDLYDIENIESQTKIGNLLNFQVYLDPTHVDNDVIFYNKEKLEKILKIIF